MRNNFVSLLAFILVVVGAINWGLIGFFEFNLVAALFGDMTILSRIVYGLVGIAAIYLIIERATAGRHVHHDAAAHGTTGTVGNNRPR